MIQRNVILGFVALFILAGCGADSEAGPTSTTVPAASSTTTSGARVPTPKTFTYKVSAKGIVETDVDDFARIVSKTLSDPRGWTMGGTFAFQQVETGADFTIWISQASLLTSFSGDCSAEYSCRVGRNVVLNDDRWLQGGKLEMPLGDYRMMVINHEIGHFLGLGHSSCPGPGQLANLMQQQSKGGSFLGSCFPNAWPNTTEKDRAVGNFGLKPRH